MHRTTLIAQIGLGQEALADSDRADSNRAGVPPAVATGERIGEEALWDFDMDTRAVAGLAVGAAMPDHLQRIDAQLHNIAPCAAAPCRHPPLAAGLAILRRGRVSARRAALLCQFRTKRQQPRDRDRKKPVRRAGTKGRSSHLAEDISVRLTGRTSDRAW